MKFPGLALLLALAVRTASASENPRGAVTFNRDVAPIIYRNCSVCHRPGGSGPFSLLTYSDAKRRASQIAAVTSKRYMPPWLPDEGHGEFQDERRLTDSEIKLLGAWAAAGAPQGSATHAPVAPQFSTEWSLGKPDLILHVEHPYVLPASGNEIFWNFILPVPLQSDRWVRAIEVRPGDARIFHHANVIIDRSGSARRQEKAQGIGFPGMDLTVEETTFDPDGHFLSWKPGNPPVAEPDGMAWHATPGMDLVLNVHLRPSGKQETVNPEIGLYFTDKPQTKYPMLIQLEHDGAIDIKPGDHDFLLSDDFRVPEDVNVLAVYPHAHYLAKLMEGYATLPDGSRKWIVRIPDWDLSWQGVFTLKQPMLLPKGTVISMRYHYDNSAANVRNPNHPPQEVKAGLRSVDEMGHLWLQVLPVEEGDQRQALQAAITEDRLGKYPNDFAAKYNMGDLLLTKGDTPGAIGYLARAAQANPNSPLGPMALGVAYFSQSKIPEAEEQFQNALRLDPHLVDARFNLASVEAEGGDLPESVRQFERVLIERPDYPKAGERLGDVLFALGDQLAKAGDNQQAVERYREALNYRSNDVALHTSLGAAYARLGRTAEARAELETAVRLNPNFEPAQKLLGDVH